MLGQERDRPLDFGIGFGLPRHAGRTDTIVQLTGLRAFDFIRVQDMQ
jgi:hypothetical protein